MVYRARSCFDEKSKIDLSLIFENSLNFDVNFMRYWRVNLLLFSCRFQLNNLPRYKKVPYGIYEQDRLSWAFTTGYKQVCLISLPAQTVCHIWLLLRLCDLLLSIKTAICEKTASYYCFLPRLSRKQNLMEVSALSAGSRFMQIILTGSLLSHSSIGRKQNPVDTWHKNDVVLMPMQRDHVALTSIRRHFGTNAHWEDSGQSWRKSDMIVSAGCKT